MLIKKGVWSWGQMTGQRLKLNYFILKSSIQTGPSGPNASRQTAVSHDLMREIHEWVYTESTKTADDTAGIFNQH